ncbi:DUF927 domain-containing protein [Comamonas testosteroni]|uniref:DUF927 domain-containing protein n=1 Tax=Comamonas testosteroni TaxID=285 RepID=UPI0018AFDCE0|nr:DUF927 domain-containing protein [Comamonas testosteroni]
MNHPSSPQVSAPQCIGVSAPEDEPISTASSSLAVDALSGLQSGARTAAASGTPLESFLRCVAAPYGYSFSREGIHFHGVDKKGNPTEEVICRNHLGIAARTRDHDGKNWAVRMMLLDGEGELQELLIPAEVLVDKVRTGTLFTMLAKLGVLINPDAGSQKRLLDYLYCSLSRQDLAKERTISRLGFVSLKDAPLAFVLPSQILIASPLQEATSAQEKLSFRALYDVPALQAYRSQGSLEDWKRVVSPFSDNALIVSSIVFGLTGPFISLIGEENCGIHYFGATSSGKTTAAQACASVAGYPGNPANGAQEASLFQTWNTTQNAAELLFAPHSGMTVTLDEVGSNDAGINLYNTFSGLGKSRMTETLGLHKQTTWSVMVVSTGEHGCAEHMESTSAGRITEGASVRMMDVPIADLHEAAIAFGAPSLPEKDVLASQVTALQSGLCTNFGSALPALVKALFDYFQEENLDLRKLIKDELNTEHVNFLDYLKDAGYTLATPQMRAMRRLVLALNIGEAACDLNILPFTKMQVLRAVTSVAIAWLRTKKFVPFEIKVAEALRDTCMRHSYLLDKDFKAQTGSSRDGLPFLYQQDKHRLIFTEQQLLNASNQNNIRAVVNALKKLNLLILSEGERRNAPKLSKEYQAILGCSRGYIVSMALLDGYLGDSTPGAIRTSVQLRLQKRMSSN